MAEGVPSFQACEALKVATVCRRRGDGAPGMAASTLWLWLLVTMIAGCGFVIRDKGSDISFSGISLVYTDWIAPAERNWLKDSYECSRDAQEAVPFYLCRIFGQNQRLAERCLVTRGYVKR